MVAFCHPENWGQRKVFREGEPYGRSYYLQPVKMLL